MDTLCHCILDISPQLRNVFLTSCSPVISSREPQILHHIPENSKVCHTGQMNPNWLKYDLRDGFSRPSVSRLSVCSRKTTFGDICFPNSRRSDSVILVKYPYSLLSRNSAFFSNEQMPLTFTSKQTFGLLKCYRIITSLLFIYFQVFPELSTSFSTFQQGYPQEFLGFSWYFTVI